MGKVKVYVEEHLRSPSGFYYKVCRVHGSTHPKMHQRLSEQDVGEMIDKGVEVIIDPPRKRRR
jgi:hypothetical protein